MHREEIHDALPWMVWRRTSGPGVSPPRAAAGERLDAKRERKGRRSGRMVRCQPRHGTRGNEKGGLQRDKVRGHQRPFETVLGRSQRGEERRSEGAGINHAGDRGTRVPCGLGRRSMVSGRTVQRGMGRVRMVIVARDARQQDPAMSESLRWEEQGQQERHGPPQEPNLQEMPHKHSAGPSPNNLSVSPQEGTLGPLRPVRSADPSAREQGRAGRCQRAERRRSRPSRAHPTRACPSFHPCAVLPHC